MVEMSLVVLVAWLQFVMVQAYAKIFLRFT